MDERVPDIPHFDDLVRTINEKQPRDAVSIVHGDFKMDNCIFHPTRPEVIAVIDWELSTIGHYGADLGNSLSPFFMTEGDPKGVLLGTPLVPPCAESWVCHQRRSYWLRTVGAALQAWTPHNFSTKCTFTLAFFAGRMPLLPRVLRPGPSRGRPARPTPRLWGGSRQCWASSRPSCFRSWEVCPGASLPPV